LDENDDFPIQFHEALGEHTLTDDIRSAIIWAAISKFLVGTDYMSDVDNAEFSDKDKQLSKSVVFHGPFSNMEKAVESSQRRGGVVIAPTHQWDEEDQPVWVACLAN
jgi:hypothetical protein